MFDIRDRKRKVGVKVTVFFIWKTQTSLPIIPDLS